jgi:hypothetical protein
MTEKLLASAAAEILRACEAERLRSVEITLAPVVFHPELVCLLHQSLRAAGFTGETPEVTHHVFFDGENPCCRFSKTALQKLRAGQRECYRFVRCSDIIAISQALGVIATNRSLKGHSPALDVEDLRLLSSAVDVAVFALELVGTKVAAAVCLPNSVTSYHIIAWGHDPTLEAKHPMNVLAFEVFSELISLGAERIDLGSSSRAGIINTGLCSFKRSLGAEASTSFRLRYVTCSPA